MIKVTSIAAEWAEAQSKYIESVQNEPYYNAEEDILNQEDYYGTIDFGQEDLPKQVHDLLVRTHNRQLDYSPHRYVYPWVDLQENLKLKSLYSGKGIDPLKAIDQDLKLLQTIHESGFHSNERVIFNTEHVVPQSWFEGRQPMKGDLHHLFACEPACNSMRSNFPTMILKPMSRKWRRRVSGMAAEWQNRRNLNRNTEKGLPQELYFILLSDIKTYL